MAHVVSATFAPHRERLGQVLAVARAQPAISLNMATFWATPRHPT